MADRRYRDEEIAAIFRAAAEEPPAPASYDTPPGVGLTLAELQAIGREVGIEPAAVARAALVLDASREAAPRRMLGLPIGPDRP